MIKLTLKREKSDEKGTLGEIRVTDRDIVCYTLELPWKDNEQNVSCIPPGTYKIKKWESPAHGWCIKIFDVHGRGDILIHIGNWLKDTLGCVLVGLEMSITRDLIGIKEKMLVKSGSALYKLMDLLGDKEGELTIVEG